MTNEEKNLITKMLNDLKENNQVKHRTLSITFNGSLVADKLFGIVLRYLVNEDDDAAIAFKLLSGMITLSETKIEQNLLFDFNITRLYLGIKLVDALKLLLPDEYKEKLFKDVDALKNLM